MSTPHPSKRRRVARRATPYEPGPRRNLACPGLNPYRGAAPDTTGAAAFGELLRSLACHDVLREILTFYAYSHDGECAHIEDCDCPHCKHKYAGARKRELLHYGYFGNDRCRTVFCAFSTVVWPESTGARWFDDHEEDEMQWACASGVRRVGAGLLCPLFIRKLLVRSEPGQFFSFYATLDPAQCEYTPEVIQDLGAFLESRVHRVEGLLPEDRTPYQPEGAGERRPPAVDAEGLEPLERREAQLRIVAHMSPGPISQKWQPRMADNAGKAIRGLAVAGFDEIVRPRMKLPVRAEAFL